VLACGFAVVETLTDGQELARSLEAHHPDLLVLDITLPGVNGIELARHVLAAPRAPGIVMLTVHEDPDYAREAFAAGALGYVVKSRLASDLAPALQAALAGQRSLSPTRELREVRDELGIGGALDAPGPLAP
jgi:DNA-binding NarL/FixJ family response regulator